MLSLASQEALPRLALLPFPASRYTCNWHFRWVPRPHLGLAQTIAGALETSEQELGCTEMPKSSCPNGASVLWVLQGDPWCDLDSPDLFFVYLSVTPRLPNPHILASSFSACCLVLPTVLTLTFWTGGW